MAKLLNILFLKSLSYGKDVKKNIDPTMIVLLRLGDIKTHNLFHKTLYEVKIHFRSYIYMYVILA